MIYRIVVIVSFVLLMIVLGIYVKRHVQGIVGYLHNLSGKIGFLRTLAYFFLLISFLVMSTSAMIPVILGSDYLSGVMLIIHVTLAPVFAGAVAFFMILTAHHMVFNEQEWRDLSGRRMSGRERFWQKIMFWLFCTGVVISASAIILMLFPLFGSEGQEVLLDIHRTASVVLVLTAAGHFWTYRPYNNNKQ